MLDSQLLVSMCVQLFSIYSYVGLSVQRCLNYAEAVTLYFSRAFPPLKHHARVICGKMMHFG